MEDSVAVPAYARPVGVLESLGDALSAVFDEEMAMWREVAQSYCRPLRMDPQPRATPEEDCVDDEDLHSDVVSQSDTAVGSFPVESASEHGRQTNSLAEKWAEVEELLATIRPTHQGQQHDKHRLDRVTPLRRKTEVELRAPLARRHVTRRLQEDLEDRNHALEVCRRMMRAWTALALARRKCRDQKQTADRHWRQSKCRSSFSRWRRLCQRWQFLEECSHEVTLLVQKHQLSTSLRHWWTIRRWSRGQRLLTAWRDERRRRQSFLCWLEIVEMSRHMKRLRRNALSRRTHDAWTRWNEFIDQQKSKRGLQQLENGFRLSRYYRFFIAGVRLLKTRRLALAVALKHHQRKEFRRVFHDWLEYNTRQRRKKMASEWRTHCLLSSSFEAWNLLHRCFVYQNRQNERAQACYSSCLLQKSVLAWRKLVVQRRQQRVGLARVIVRRLQRLCLRQLQDAVDFERALGHRLQRWKVRRRIQAWRLRARRRVTISTRRQQVEAMHRVRLLHSFAWRLWREACDSRRRVKKLIALAEQNVLRTWWRRWRDFGTVVKARCAILQIVDIERRRRQQRRAVQHWRQFCASQIKLSAASSVSIRHFSAVMLKTTFRQWKSWLYSKLEKRVRVVDAERLFLRHRFRYWRTRAHNQALANCERVDTIIRHHPLWLTRTWFVVWRHNTKRHAVGRVARLFELWRQFVMRADQGRRAKQLGESIRLRQSWLRWAALRAETTRTRELSQLLEGRARNQLLYKALIEVWWTKTIRFRKACAKMQRIGAIAAMHNTFRCWQKRVVAKKQLLRATQWYIRSTRLKFLRALYAFSIIRPRELAQIRRTRHARRLFDAWVKETGVLRRIRLATSHLDKWREKKAVDKLLTRCKQRRCRDEWVNSAQSFHQHRLLRGVFDAWLRFTASMLTCQDAFEQIRFAARQRVFKSWQRAVARQLFVHELESQFDHALLRQAWTNLRDAIRQKQEARRDWLTRLSTVLLRKALQRWRQLVEVQNLQLLVASSRASRAQSRLLQQVFDEWTHFASIRVFVTVRQRREAGVLKTRSLRQWKVYVLLRYQVRRRKQQVKSKIFAALKRHAIVCEASREVQYRCNISAVSAAWKAWRLEFWIKRSQKSTSAGLLHRCFHAWQSHARSQVAYDQEERRVSPASPPNSTQRNSDSQLTAFAEAMLLQHIVRRQRVTMQRVVHAWALVVQTSKRQRTKDESRRLSKVRRISKKSKQKQAGFAQGEDDENVNPNTGRTKLAASSVSYEFDEEEAELMALEHWSSRLLHTAFNEWRRHCLQ